MEVYRSATILHGYPAQDRPAKSIALACRSHRGQRKKKPCSPAHGASTLQPNLHSKRKARLLEVAAAFAYCLNNWGDLLASCWANPLAEHLAEHVRWPGGGHPELQVVPEVVARVATLATRWGHAACHTQLEKLRRQAEKRLRNPSCRACRYSWGMQFSPWEFRRPWIKATTVQWSSQLRAPAIHILSGCYFHRFRGRGEIKHLHEE